jgi:Spy/CpxP family protein refolding chaperone
MKSITLPYVRAAMCVALVVASVPAFGQGFKWWQDVTYQREMVLSADQTRFLEDIFQKAVPTLKIQKTKLDEAEVRFQRLIEQGDAAAMEQINVVESARFELNKTRATMLFHMRKVLTEEQYVKLTALQAARAKQAQGAKPPAPAARP